MFGLMLSLVHCQGLFGGEEEEDCTLGQIQPCDCLLDGQLTVGTQVCGLYGEYDACECDSDGNSQDNERSEDRAEGAEDGTDGGEGGPDGGEGASGGGEGNSDGEEISPVEAELLIEPESLSFGFVPVGQMNDLSLTMTAKNGPVTITDIALKEASSLAYQLDYSSLPGFEDGGKPGPETPLNLEENQSAEVIVRFTPDAESPKDENNQALPEMGTIVIENDTVEPGKEVQLEGTAVSEGCPVAVIVVEEGEQVIPQTLVQLYGKDSFSPGSTINKWEWSVEQPLNSQSSFLPSASYLNPSFEANVAGKYLFKLTVVDENNSPSCVPAEAELVVIPDEAIQIQLTWNTPNDPDQTDEGPEPKADLDLHFLHPYAGGPDLDGNGEPDGYFDQPFDCFWYNPAPNWSSVDPTIDDNPKLVRDDTDGSGPEILSLKVPEDGMTYKVAAHYWADHGFGTSYASLYVYIYSELVYVMEDVAMENYDMWEALTIDWPSGEVKFIGDGQQIIPEYVNPFFF